MVTVRLGLQRQSRQRQRFSMLAWRVQQDFLPKRLPRLPGVQFAALYRPASWVSGVTFKHSAALGSCASCHNGTSAPGKPSNHPQTSAACDDCHATSNWTAVRFDHSGVTGACSTCHNGKQATGKPANHIASSANCDNCHVTTNWTNVRVDHNDVIGSCSSCHNGTKAPGKPANHISTSAECDSCHAVLAWLPARFDHANVTGSCSNCHNGTKATGKPSGHFQTSLQCDECHRTTSWASPKYSHSSSAYPSGHTGVTCRGCHTANSEAVTWSAPALKPDCAGCHSNDFKASEHKKYTKPTTVFYTAAELRDCTGACHTYTDSSMTTISQNRSGKHRAGGDW